MWVCQYSRAFIGHSGCEVSHLEATGVSYVFAVLILPLEIILPLLLQQRCAANFQRFVVCEDGGQAADRFADVG